MPVLSTVPPSAAQPIAGTTLKVRDLLPKHPDYRADLLDEYAVWYRGGQAFREALARDDTGRFLVARRLDAERLTDRGFSYRDARKARAAYVPEAGRIIASVIALAFRRLPRILAEGADAAFFHALNDNADGAGTDLAQLLWRLMEGGFLAGRAYLGAWFPGLSTSGMDLQQARAARALDGKLRLYPAQSVDWWGRDPLGRLSMVRIYSAQDFRAQGQWGRLTRRLHTWSVVDDATITQYQFMQPALEDGSMPELVTQADKDVTVLPSARHGFPRLPVVEYSFARDFWLMDRLVDPQKRLFNSEADEAFIRAECAHPVRWIAGDLYTEAAGQENAPGPVKASPVHGLRLSQGGSYNVTAPDAGQSAWHSDAIGREHAGLYAALEALYLDLAKQGQNARQAASAKSQDRSNSTMFVAFAAASLEDCALTALKLIREMRGSESTSLALEGLDQIDGRSLGEAIADADALLKLNPPDAAKEAIVRDLAARAVGHASPELLDEIRTAPLPKPTPPAVPAFGRPSPARTASGMPGQMSPGRLTQGDDDE